MLKPFRLLNLPKKLVLRSVRRDGRGGGRVPLEVGGSHRGGRGRGARGSLRLLLPREESGDGGQRDVGQRQLEGQRDLVHVADLGQLVDGLALLHLLPPPQHLGVLHLAPHHARPRQRRRQVARRTLARRRLLGVLRLRTAQQQQATQ